MNEPEETAPTAATGVALPPRGEGGTVMADGAAPERRRQKINERIAAGRLPASLNAEEPTWIPSSYVVGGEPADCHFCAEAIHADEALLVRDGEQCHPACEQAWRELVTGERGDGDTGHGFTASARG